MFQITLQRIPCGKQKEILCTHSIRITLNEERHNLQFWLQREKGMFSVSREHEEFFALCQRETLNALLSNQPVV